MQIATSLIGKSLKKFPRESKSEGTGHVLAFIHHGHLLLSQLIKPTPDQIRSSAKIYNAPRQTFIHRHKCLRAKRIARVESGAITANPLFIPQSLRKRLSQSNPAILHRMMGIHLQIARTIQLQVDYCMLRKKGQHMVEKGYSRADGRLSPPINFQFD